MKKRCIIAGVVGAAVGFIAAIGLGIAAGPAGAFIGGPLLGMAAGLGAKFLANKYIKGPNKQEVAEKGDRAQEAVDNLRLAAQSDPSLQQALEDSEAAIRSLEIHTGRQEPKESRFDNDSMPGHMQEAPKSETDQDNAYHFGNPSEA